MVSVMVVSVDMDGRTDLGRHANLRQPDQRAGAAVAGDGAGGEDGDEDDGVHHVGEGGDAGVAEGDDEGRGVGAGAAEEVRVLRVDGDGHNEGAQNVEQAQAEPDGAGAMSARSSSRNVSAASANESRPLRPPLRRRYVPNSPGNRLPRIGRLTSHEPSILRPGHGKNTRGHHTQETLKSIDKRLLIPVPKPNGIIVGRAAGGDDDAGEDDDEDPAELDHGADDLDLAEDVDGADVDEHDDDPEDGDPGRDGHGVGPEAEDGADGLELVGDGDPLRNEMLRNELG